MVSEQPPADPWGSKPFAVPSDLLLEASATLRLLQLPESIPELRLRPAPEPPEAA